MSAREDVLGRVRAALGPPAPAPDVPRAYHRAGARPASVDAFAAAAAAYRAEVVRVAGQDALGEAIARACERRGTRRLGVAPGLAVDVPGVQLVAGDELDLDGLDGLDGALTGCALAIAQTGTIVLDASPACGRRALTLVPDHHVCVVRAEQVVAAVPDAIARLDPERPLTFVSGPSATSDIELERVEGVHGPRMLDVLVV